MIDAKDFRQALGRFATGVTIVTVEHEGHIRGITVSAFMSLSLEPPLVAICIDKNAQAHLPLLHAKRYGVSVLASDQTSISNHFAGMPSLEDDPFTIVQDMPVIADALATIICTVDATHDTGDHTLFVGRVTHLEWREDAEPLLYYRGRYGDFGQQ
jgi:flavin reductase (DIM6/NTAB) family NADH-FMN oxidoreductase RutF